MYPAGLGVSELKTAFRKPARAVSGPAVFAPGKSARPVFVAGTRYPSLFDADLDSGVRAVSIWKAAGRRDGGPVQIRPNNGRSRIVINRRKVLVVMEAWVMDRASLLRREYAL